MAIIGFVNQKGGVGKSTTCYHFAYWLHKNGHKVLLVDADAQTSSATWVKQADVKIDTRVIQGGDEFHRPDHLTAARLLIERQAVEEHPVVGERQAVHGGLGRGEPLLLLDVNGLQGFPEFGEPFVVGPELLDQGGPLLVGADLLVHGVQAVQGRAEGGEVNFGELR